MPTLVHLADEKEAASIKRNGIKIGKFRQGIFCMPVLQNFYLSHQWLRELKRRGVKTFVGIYFKADSSTKVFAGRYNKEHQHITLGQAIEEIQTMTDPLGYEIIIDRKIKAKEIQKIKNIPQNIGWRYQPRSNGQKPCGCEYCIKSSIKANRIREKCEDKVSKVSYGELLKRLKELEDIDQIEDILTSDLRLKMRRSDPNELMFLLKRESVSLDQGLALALGNFRHKNTKSMLLVLLEKADDDTREYAADSLLKLYGKEAEEYLKNSKDSVVQTALTNWREEYNS